MEESEQIYAPRRKWAIGTSGVGVLVIMSEIISGVQVTIDNHNFGYHYSVPEAIGGMVLGAALIFTGQYLNHLDIREAAQQTNQDLSV